MSESAHWSDPVVRRVALAAGMELVRVRAVDWVGVGSLLRALVRAGHSAHVTTRVEALRELPHGAVVLYLPREEELEALNLLRPWLAARALRLILWSTDELRAPLQRNARDVLDWVVESVDASDRVVPFWQANLRAAARAGAPGFRWDAPFEFETLLRSVTATPRVRALDVTGLSFGAISSVLMEHRAEWVVVRGLRAPEDLATKRLRWAAAHIGHRRLVLERVVDPAPIDGWWPLHTEQHDPMAFEAERVEDAEARALQRGHLLRAALVDFEPCPNEALQLESIDALASQHDPVASLLGPKVDDPWEALATEGWTATTRGSVNNARWIAGRDACVERARDALVGKRQTAIDVRRAVVECRAAFELTDNSSAATSLQPDVRFELLVALAGLSGALPDFAALARAARDFATARELYAQHRSERWATGREGLDDAGWQQLFLDRIELALEAGLLDDALVVLGYAEKQESPKPLTSRAWLLLDRAEVHVRRGEWSLANTAVVRARSFAPRTEPAFVDVRGDRWFAVAAAEPERRCAALALEIALLARGRWTTDEQKEFDELRSRFGSSNEQDIRVRLASERVAAVHALIHAELREALGSLLAYSKWNDDLGAVRDTRYALLLVAWCQRELGMLSDARGTLQRVLEFESVARNAYHPDKLRAFVELSRVDRAEGRYKRARARLRKALRRYPSALPETAPEVRGAVLESATLALVEAPVTSERLVEAERALASLRASLSPVHWEVRRAEGEIAAARGRL